MITLFGQTSAFLEEPRINSKNVDAKLKAEYEDYERLYGRFFHLATTFNSRFIPVTRLVHDSATNQQKEEFTIPAYCDDNDDDEENGDAVKKAEIRREKQLYHMNRWTELRTVVKELSDHPYVHRRSKLTRVVMSYRWRTGAILRDVDVTTIPYIVPPEDIIEGSRRIVPDPRTNAQYEDALMAMVRAQ